LSIDILGNLMDRGVGSPLKILGFWSFNYNGIATGRGS